MKPIIIWLLVIVCMMFVMLVCIELQYCCECGEKQQSCCTSSMCITISSSQWCKRGGGWLGGLEVRALARDRKVASSTPGLSATE